MTETILEGVTRRVGHLRTLTDPSGAGADAPTYLLDVVEALRSCALLRDYLSETFKLLWKALIENELADCDLAGRIYLMGLSITQKTFAAVRDRAEEVKARAAVPNGSSAFGEALVAFGQAVKDVEALEQNLRGRWPWFDQDKLNRSIADERQGVRRRSLQEVHDDLRRRVR